jgi:hypothetical protein
MALDWTWEIDEDGEIAFEVFVPGQEDDPILAFTLDTDAVLEELAIDVQRSHYEGDPESLDEWNEMLTRLRMLTTEMERILK